MAKVSTFAGSVLLAQGGSFEPQRKSNWALVIPDLGDSDTLILSLKHLVPPALAMSQQHIKYFNTSTHYPGALAPVEAVTIQYRDYIDREVMPLLAAWYRKVYNPATGSIGRASSFKKRGSLFLLPPGMEAGDAPGAVESSAYNDRVWVMTGLYPAKLKYDDLDHDDEGTNALINLDLSCDLCYPKQMEG